MHRYQKVLLGGTRMKKNAGERYFVFFSLVQIALLIICFLLMYISFSRGEIQVFGVGSTGAVREWYWYELFLIILSYLIPILILLNGFVLCVKLKRKVRVAGGCYVFAVLSIAAIIGRYDIVSAILVIYVCFFAISVAGIVFRKRIIRGV